MPVTAVVALANSNTANDPATTASVNPQGWPVVLFCTVSSATTAATTLTATANGGGTFSQVAVVGPDATTARALFVMVSYNLVTGTVTLDANVTATAYNWTFLRMVGAAPWTRQTAVGTWDSDWDLVDTITATLGSAPVATSKLVAAGCVGSTSDSMVEGSGLSELDVHAVATPSTGLHTSWTALAVQQAASYTQTGGNNAVGGVMAHEVVSQRRMTLVGVG